MACFHLRNELERQYVVHGGGDYAAYGYGDHNMMDDGSKGGSYHPNFHHHVGFVEHAHGAPSPQSPSDRSNSPSLPPVNARPDKSSGSKINQ